MGGSGSGKTTLLEAICGLRKITSGELLLASVMSANCRRGAGVGYVPQDRALFPMMLVREQLAFGLVFRALARPDRQASQRTGGVARDYRLARPHAGQDQWR
ncbi:MAG: hypothetical protein Ct9H300mP32_5360 [Verrucomicrobiota bacterium]|nr:MAG: hypothetical protein Ct9H300mP32_5360 [Verrucomicrobiota bacterium]